MRSFRAASASSNFCSSSILSAWLPGFRLPSTSSSPLVALLSNEMPPLGDEMLDVDGAGELWTGLLDGSTLMSLLDASNEAGRWVLGVSDEAGVCYLKKKKKKMTKHFGHFIFVFQEHGVGVHSIKYQPQKCILKIWWKNENVCTSPVYFWKDQHVITYRDATRLCDKRQVKASTRAASQE